MISGIPPHSAAVESMYDGQAEAYVAYHEPSFAWQFIERPAIDRYLVRPEQLGLPALCRSDTRVLDVCCGAALPDRYLVQCGIKPANITGVDVSSNMISRAAELIPEAHFLHASADSFTMPPGSVDLGISIMGLHYLDNVQLVTLLELMYQALSDNGTFFFIDADPDYNEETRDPSNVNRWLQLPTPWGGTAPWFSRSPHELLLDHLYYAGFDLAAGGPLPVSDAGRVDPGAYQKYTSYPARIGARLHKVSEAEKQRRLSAVGQSIPDLVDWDTNTAGN
jgi:SAM-dependent methyltransferase